MAKSGQEVKVGGGEKYDVNAGGWDLKIRGTAHRSMSMAAPKMAEKIRESVGHPNYLLPFARLD